MTHEIKNSRRGILLSLLLLAACDGGGGGDQKVVLTILHTNDLHSHLEAPKAHEFGLGGLARLATKIKQLKAQAPGPVLVLDAGDWSEGSAHYRVDNGAHMLKFFEAAGYDAVVVGNHDYLAGPDVLKNVVQSANPGFPVLASNLNLSQYPGATEFRNLIPKSAVFEKGGIKIGVLGLTTDDIEYKSFIEPVTVKVPLLDAEIEVPKLKLKSDVVIVLSHNSFESNKFLAKAVPFVHAVVSGHSHKKVSQAITVLNAGRTVPVVETGEWGQFVGELQLEVNLANKAVKYKKYKLHPVLPTLPEDAEIRTFIEDMDQQLAQSLGQDPKEVVTQTEIKIAQNDSYEANLGDLATKAYRTSVGAQIGMEIMPLTGVTIPKGGVTVQDLHDVMPHFFNPAIGSNWTVKLWHARGLDIQKIAYSFYMALNLFGFSKNGFLCADGMEVVWSGSGQGPVPHIEDIFIQGAPIQSNAIYTVALTDGFLTAIDIVSSTLGLGIDISDITDTGIESSQAIIDYGRTLPLITHNLLREGGQSRTESADPAVFHYDVLPQPGSLNVLVRNEGLQTSSPITLTCKRGKVNDYLQFGTEWEAPYTAIGTVAVGVLPPSGQQWVTVPFSTSGIQGALAIECKVTSSVDGYLGNSLTRTLVQIP